MSWVSVYVKPAKDYFELNLYEARALSRFYSARSELVRGDSVVFELPEHNVTRFLSRLCGSRDAGIYLGEFVEADLERGLRLASKLLGGRSYKVQAESRGLVERVVGALGSNVDMRSPEVVVWIRGGGHTYTVGMRFQTARARLSALQPKNWVYFHPGALQPFFCGLMCNLAAPIDGGLILDPFCGVGSTLVAASMLGFRAVGLDLSKKQVYGCRRNILELKVGDFAGVVRGDAASPPFRSGLFDAAVFDPPYGKVSSLFGRSFEGLIDEVADSLWGLLRDGGRACFLVPQGSGGLERFVSRGFKLGLTYPIPVHKRLTRLVVVAQKVA